jgi:hypothetical protein
MYSWLSTTQLHDIGVALILDNGIEHALNLFDRGEASNIGVSKTGWAAQIASLGDLDKRQAGVLFVISTQTAIQWTTLLDRRLEVPG